MKKLTKTLLIAMLVIGTACTSQAQEEDSKIKIKITKEVDGKKETFEREYASSEEMRDDDEFREFAGDDNDFDFHFDMNGMHEQIIELREGSGARAFSFSMDNEKGPHKRMRGQHFGGRGGNAFWFGDDDAVVDFRSFDSEEYEEELEEKMAELEERLKGLDKDLKDEIMESMKEIEEMSSGIFPRRINRKSISIEDVDSGKSKKVDGKVKFDTGDFDAEDMDLMIMGSRLTLRFKVKDPGELTVKVSNESGKDIYNRYFEEFGGTFSDNIDFSKYADGKYLLEISKDKKRLTKKIVVE